MEEPAGQYRAELDFEIGFSNGGGLSGSGFRIDIEDPSATPRELGAALIRDLGLLMADRVEIRHHRILRERHKRALPAADPAGAPGALRRADLSHVIEDGMITYPGLPAPRVRPDSVSAGLPAGSYGPGVEFSIGEITLCGNTGTYVDSPFHRYPDGADLALLPLDRLAELDAVVADVTGSAQRAIDRNQLIAYDLRGKAVLVRTGWDRHWGTTAYGTGHPFLTRDAADHLVEAGALLVGIDSLNIDDTADPERPVHSALLAAGIPVCEHLTNLGALPAAGLRFSAVPPMVAAFGTFPVRAYGTWPAS
jgi:arylformamidase